MIRLARRPGSRQQMRWIVSSRMAARFLADISPFIVSVRVLAKADLALEFQGQKARSGHNPVGYNARQQAFFEEMKRLNQKGDRAIFTVDDAPDTQRPSRDKGSQLKLQGLCE